MAGSMEEERPERGGTSDRTVSATTCKELCIHNCPSLLGETVSAIIIIIFDSQSAENLLDRSKNFLILNENEDIERQLAETIIVECIEVQIGCLFREPT